MMKPDLNPTDDTLRVFAWSGIVGLPLLTGIGLRLAGAFAWDHPALWIAGGAAALLAVAAQFGVLLPVRVVYTVLVIATWPIGVVVSTTLLAAIYYGLFTPLGLVFRLIGRDAMGRRRLPSNQSYWSDRGPARRPDSYFKLY